MSSRARRTHEARKNPRAGSYQRQLHTMVGEVRQMCENSGLPTTLLGVREVSFNMIEMHLGLEHYNAIDPSLVAGDSPAHVAAEYGPNTNRTYKELIVSQEVAVPEPPSVTLLLTGLLAIGVLALRRLITS